MNSLGKNIDPLNSARITLKLAKITEAAGISKEFVHHILHEEFNHFQPLLSYVLS